MFDRKNNLIIFFLVLYIFMSTSNNLNFRNFEIKPQVPRTSNLRDSTVYIRRYFLFLHETNGLGSDNGYA